MFFEKGLAARQNPIEQLPETGLGLEGELAMSELKTRDDVFAAVKKVAVENLKVDEAKVVENASFIDDLGADSLDTVELVMNFEEEFEIEISDDEAEKVLTVKDAVDLVCDNLGIIT